MRKPAVCLPPSSLPVSASAPVRGTPKPARRSARRFLFIGTLLGVSSPLALPVQQAWAVGEQNARLRGQVVEAGTNVPMPGARIETSSDALIGGPRRTVTDEDGNFDFTLLPPGRYLLTISYEGLRPTKRKLTLEVGQTESLKIPLTAELAASETTVIVEERKRLDSDRLSTGKVLTAEQQSKLATPRRYQDVVQQLAGVTGGSNPVMAGGSLRHNRYLVDGLDITDPVDNTFSANFNFDAIAQMDMLLLAVDAQYNSLGGVINLVTKRGSDKFTLDTSLYVNHQALSAGARSGSQLYEGRLLDQSDPRPPTSSYQANLNIGGPLIKQKLWYYFSTEYRYRVTSVVPGPPLNIQHPPLERHDLYARLKLTWAPASKHRLELSVNGDPTYLSNIRNLAPDNGNTNSYSAESEFYQRQGGVFGILNWDWFVTDKVIVNVQTGLHGFGFSNGPQNGDAVSSSHFDRASTITWNATDANLLVVNQRWRYQLDPTITWLKKGWAGSHTFKAGAQLQYLRNYALVGTPGNSVYTDDTAQPMDAGRLQRDPTSTQLPPGCVPGQPAVPGAPTPCFQLTQYEPQRAQVRTGYAAGVFLQDTWKPTSYLTLVPGIRVDYGTTRNSEGEVVQNLLGIGPRIGASLDLTRDGKTLLKLAYGRSNEVASLRIATYADANSRNSTWGYNRATGRFDSFFSSEGGAGGYDLRGTCPDGSVTLACGNAKLNLSPPHADFVTASIERELYANLAGAITYTYRLISSQWEDIEVNARRTLDGGNIAGFGDPSQGNIRVYRPTAEAIRRYQAVDFTVAGNPSPNWQLFVGYTLSFLDGTVDDQLGNFRNDPPRDFRYFGYLNDDHRHAIKANGNYSWKGLTAGVSMQYLTGAPTTRLYLQNLGYTGRYGWRGIDPNADPNDVRKWTELRSPDVFDLSVRAQYDFHQLTGQHISLIVDVFNALNLSTAVNAGANTTNQVGFEARNSPSYGTALSRQAPLRAQFGIRYQY
jgi:hypothetical protein